MTMTAKAIHPDNQKIKSEFASLWGSIDQFEQGLDSAKIDVSVMLCSLLDQSGISRTQLAEKLSWKPSRITRVLSGDENLTLKTIFEVCHATGHTFDVVVRKPGEHTALQPWQREEMLANFALVKRTLQETRALLDTAKDISRRHFALSHGWTRAVSTQRVIVNQTFAANDAGENNVAVSG
jgi:transcriptional regulator with XRE-family HTH domain